MDNRDIENGDGRTQELPMVDIQQHYDGSFGFSKWVGYRNPTRAARTEPNAELRSSTVPHRDFLGRITRMPQDLARYVSPTYAKIFYLIVQATPRAYGENQGEWRRRKLIGNANTLIRVAVWTVGDLNDPLPKDRTEQALLALRVLLVLPAMMCLMPIPIGPGRRTYEYPVFFGRSWDYPKYPRNLLDGYPSQIQQVHWENHIYNVSGNHDRLLQPVRLMVKQSNNRWKLVRTDLGQSPAEAEPYIVISYASRQFHEDQRGDTNQRLERLAEEMAGREGVSAYWIDYKCIARTQPELSEDIHRICDVFRGAKQVYAAVPDDTLASKQFWGSRMWCLPEARRLPS